jgi:hypothetical protein
MVYNKKTYNDRYDDTGIRLKEMVHRCSIRKAIGY